MSVWLMFSFFLSFFSRFRITGMTSSLQRHSANSRLTSVSFFGIQGSSDPSSFSVPLPMSPGTNSSRISLTNSLHLVSSTFFFQKKCQVNLCIFIILKFFFLEMDGNRDSAEGSGTGAPVATGRSGIVRLSAIRELVEKGRHALLDITPGAVDKLNYAQFYPVVIFLRADSKHTVKELRAGIPK